MEDLEKALQSEFALNATLTEQNELLREQNNGFRELFIIMRKEMDLLTEQNNLLRTRQIEYRKMDEKPA